MSGRVALVAGLALALAGCGGGGGDEAASPPTEPPAATETAGTGANACRDVDQPAARAEGAEKAPKEILNVDKTYLLTFRTSCGDFTVRVEAKSAPKATASFVALAQNDFFDGTFFHRIVPGFVIQGGDPTGSGTGGPGYTTVDTPAQGTRYTKGVVAMAKAPTEPAGSAGSQFFVVTGEDAALPPEYAVIGRVSKGIDVVARIGLLGDPNTEHPTQPVVIEDVVVAIS